MEQNPVCLKHNIPLTPQLTEHDAFLGNKFGEVGCNECSLEKERERVKRNNERFSEKPKPVVRPIAHLNTVTYGVILILKKIYYLDKHLLVFLLFLRRILRRFAARMNAENE